MRLPSKRHGRFLVALVCLPLLAWAARPLSWGDQGDGTYRNPVLPSDFSDPDIVRVGSDFYLVASDFHFVGIQVLHSADLVNWRFVGQVFPRLSMHPRYERMEGYAQGTWAPSLRYHEGLYYLYVCTPHDGLFRWTAKDPAGPWSEMLTVKAVDGWEDPCPFWDEDGKAYLVHSRLGAGPLILHRMSGDGSRLLDEGVEIYSGPVAEGPKLFKRKGWYYISLPEGGVSRGGQTVLRSKSVYGPYERRVVLADGSPHQGGIVELENGESWFIGFKSSDYLGRVAHLLPVRWGEDGWPVFGDEGRAVERWRKPSLPAANFSRPRTCDAFSLGTLGLQWQWNHNPVPSAWSLAERPGWLRLRALPAAELALARNTLTQKLWGERSASEVKLDARGLGEGQRAGLAFMSGKVFSSVGVVRENGELRFYWNDRKGPPVSAPMVRLRAEHEGNRGRLLYSADGRSYTDTGLEVLLKFSQWKGARVAVFCFGEGEGCADFDYFRMTLEP